MLPALKNIPATDAVIRQAKLTARSARKPNFAKFLLRPGTNAAKLPINIANDAI